MFVMSKRTKINPKIHRGIVEVVGNRAYDWVAAQAHGIGKRTFYTWIQEGEDAPSQSAFRQDVLRAVLSVRSTIET